MASPPKPWERGAAGAANIATTPSSVTMSPSSSEPPSVPERPPAFSNPSTSIATPYNSLQSSYNTPYSPYSRLGSSYSSPYSTSMYGGYGGMGHTYGTGYGGYGSYGMNSMYGGMPGMGGMGSMGGMGGMGGMGMYPGMDPNNPSLTQSLETTTQHTFSLLHSIVQTFSGVSQMLESTFMATHSSFFAMVGVIEQFAHLRNALGSEVVRAPSSTSSIQGEFREFINGKPVQGPMTPPAGKPSRKPIIIFCSLFSRAMQQQQAQIGPGPLGPLDPSTLTFARALYPFTPSSPSELALKENEIVAIMGKLDPNTSEWWKGRTREGREGWFPKKWVEVLERRKPVEEGKKVV
ncbi:Peroxin 13, N-terminal region-domain-containing protein [Suillus ampliporus]|nr:Peroxin 13, N-terminal region-domain-containing protein [Suillus ampliporus]